jgi:hypothetical protein
MYPPRVCRPSHHRTESEILVVHAPKIIGVAQAAGETLLVVFPDLSSARRGVVADPEILAAQVEADAGSCVMTAPFEGVNSCGVSPHARRIPESVEELRPRADPRIRVGHDVLAGNAAGVGDPSGLCVITPVARTLIWESSNTRRLVAWADEGAPQREAAQEQSRE